MKIPTNKNQIRKVNATMIYQNSSFEKTEIAFLQAFKTLKQAELLRRSGIRKTQGISVSEVFKFLLLLVFQGKNLYRFLDSKRQESAVSKNSYYGFLNTSTFNWRHFLNLLSTKVIVTFSRLTRPERVKVFIS